MEHPTYWDSKGKYGKLLKKLADLVPVSGSVPEPKKNRALEKFRKASNCYYDLYNNGLCNRAAEFRQVFGFGGTIILKDRYRDVDLMIARLEQKMDEIILAAALEQGLIKEEEPA